MCLIVTTTTMTATKNKIYKLTKKMIEKKKNAFSIEIFLWWYSVLRIQRCDHRQSIDNNELWIVQHPD